MKISIIIVTFHSFSLINDCLKSIEKFNDLPDDEVEIIIVDNSSLEESIKIKNFINTKYPSVKFIKNEKNSGYGHGNNTGIEIAEGEIICIMNPDVRLAEKVFTDVTARFKNNKLGLLGFKQIGGGNYSFYLRPEYTNILSSILIKFFNKINIFLPRYFFLSGAFFFISKSKFSEIGNFDENIFLYYEESDITKRLLSAGYQVQYDKNIIYYHLIGKRHAFSESIFKWQITSLAYYLDKFKFNKNKILNKLRNELYFKYYVAKMFGRIEHAKKFNAEISVLSAFTKNIHVNKSNQET